MRDLSQITRHPVLSTEWKAAIEAEMVEFFRDIIKIAESEKQFEAQAAILEHNQICFLTDAVLNDDKLGISIPIMDQSLKVDMLWNLYQDGNKPGAMFILDTEGNLGDAFILQIFFRNELKPHVYIAPYTESEDQITFEPIQKADDVVSMNPANEYLN